MSQESALPSSLPSSSALVATTQRPPSQKVCTHCRKNGHVEATCWTKHGRPASSRGGGKPAQVEGNNNHGFAANVAGKDGVGTTGTIMGSYGNAESVMMTTSTTPVPMKMKCEEATRSTVSACTWYLDSGASVHLSGCASHMVKYRSIPPKNITLADGRMIQAVGCGTIPVVIWIDKSTSMNVEISDVLYVPDMVGTNLLSVKHLTARGWKVAFEGTQAIIVSSTGKVVVVATIQGNLYRVPFQHRVMEKAASATGDREACYAAAGATGGTSDYATWHARLGHLNRADMIKLQTKNMVSGYQWKLAVGLNDPNPICEGCVYGKLHRSNIPHSATTRPTDLLQLVVTDTCGPMRVPSLGGARYFVTFIDVYSGYVTTYLMPTKDQVFHHLKIYRAWAENHTGRKMKVWRTDGGGENCSNAIAKYLQEAGIEHQVTAPYTPQQNGVAERANRTLVEMARCMIHYASLVPRLWGEMISTSTYLRNRCPTSVLDNKTPYEVWNDGIKPSLANLRVIGCKAYFHDKDPRIGKFDAKAKLAIMIGYQPGTKAWRLLDPNTNKIVISRDVTFSEHEFYIRSDSSGDKHVVEWEPVGVIASEHVDNALLRPEIEIEIEPVGAAPNANGGHANNIDILQHNPDHEPHTPPFDDADDGGDDGGDSAESEADAVSSTSSSSSEDEPVPPMVAPGNVSRYGRVRSAPIPHWDVQERNRQEQQTRARVSNAHLMALAAAAESTDNQSDPNTLQQAYDRPDGALWEAAVSKEYQSILKAGTYTLVTPPPNCNIVGNKWVLKKKSDGRYKARLVAQGFSQKAGIDYNETFAPVAKFASIRALLAMTAYHGYEAHQMDVNTAYLNGDLDVDVYMKQPVGFVEPGKEHLVCKLHKSLYGLKQSGRQWYEKIHGTFTKMGFQSSHADACVYYLHQDAEVVYIALYVDDLLLLSSSLQRLLNIKKTLAASYEMKDLGEVRHILGIQVHRDRQARVLSIDQSAYIKTIVTRFGMWESKPVMTPMDPGTKLSKAQCPATSDEKQAMDKVPYQACLGAIMYAMLGTRPDIAFAVTTLGQFASDPGQAHWLAMKRLLRYLRGTMDYKLRYGFANERSQLTQAIIGYSDSNYADDVDDRKSVGAYVFMLFGGAISWQAKKQSTVALSSTEAEYMAVTQAAKEALWWRAFMTSLGCPTLSPSTLYSDNLGCIALSKNPEYHSRTKHIDVKHHFVRQCVENGSLTLAFVGTTEMAADMLTKALSRDKHQHCMSLIGVHGTPAPSGASGSVENHAS
jgi:hypothetical protein